MVHYAVLGSVELFRDGQRRSLGGLRQRALLIEFLVHANEELSTDRLIDDVWGSEGSVKRLHTAIKRLRDALGPGPDGETPLHRTTSGYRLVVAAGELDADVFEQSVLEASAAIGDDPLRARGLVEHALTLWRGPALADVAYESFAQDAIRRLNERRADAEELGARAELLLGRGNDAIRRLDELVAKHPERGAVVALLMEALYAAGRQEQALAAYQRVRRHLLDVGLEPGPNWSHSNAGSTCATRRWLPGPSCLPRCGGCRPVSDATTSAHSSRRSSTRHAKDRGGSCASVESPAWARRCSPVTRRCSRTTRGSSSAGARRSRACRRRTPPGSSRYQSSPRGLRPRSSTGIARSCPASCLRSRRATLSRVISRPLTSTRRDRATGCSTRCWAC